MNEDMRTLTEAMKTVNDSIYRQYNFAIELWDVLSSSAPAISAIIASTANSSFQLDVTEFVKNAVNIEDPGDRQASRATLTLMDKTDRFAPWGADARFIQRNCVVRVKEGDLAVPTADWVYTFTGHIQGQAGYSTDRQGLLKETAVQAYGRRATPKFLRMPFNSKTYGRRENYGTICQDIAKNFMNLSGDEMTRTESDLGYVTQFAANSIAEMTPLEAIDKILEAVGKVTDFDGTGRLRYYSKDMTRSEDKRYTDLRLIGRITIPQAAVDVYNSVSIVGLDKNITQVESPNQQLARASITVGFWRPVHTAPVVWSRDRSTRAQNTYMKITTSVKDSLALGFGATETYNELDDFSGEISVSIATYLAGLMVLIGVTYAIQALIGDETTSIGTLTIPVGKVIQAVTAKLINTALSQVSTGQYEILGTALTPVYKEFSVVLTETGTPDYLLHRKEIKNDWINEQNHALYIGQVETIFEKAQGEPREFTVLNDLQLEIGDIVYLPFGGGLRIWVDSIRKSINRGAIPMMQIGGYRAL